MPLSLAPATDATEWDAFLRTQPYRPFLQTWTMGDVYADIGQEPVRLVVRRGGNIIGTCFAHVVPARRGRHLSVPYGPVTQDPEACTLLLQAVCEAGAQRACAFVRLSPFCAPHAPTAQCIEKQRGRNAPLHLLAEHLWYLPLVLPDPWSGASMHTPPLPRSDEEIFKGMRSTARNLIRRAEKEGVTVRASSDPLRDLQNFLLLHDETRRRHKFTPYSTAFFTAQVSRFAPRNEATVYLAEYRGEVISASIHMHVDGETSYHHGASTLRYRNIPASYLLQWRAICDALGRGDLVYNFWGISPEGALRHPFAGVRTFKTAFGGSQLELAHCMDIPLSKMYYIARGIETVRKWKRGF